MVTGFRDGQCLFNPVNGGVGNTEPGESENDIFLATAYDIEEVFLGDLLNVCVEGASVMNCTSLICSLVHVSDCNRGGKFLSGELVFSDKLPVNAGDVSTRVYQCQGVNNFQSV